MSLLSIFLRFLPYLRDTYDSLIPQSKKTVLIGKHSQNTLNKAFMANHTFHGTEAMSSPLSFHRTRRRTLRQWFWRDWRWPSIRWGWLFDACNMAAKVATFVPNRDTNPGLNFIHYNRVKKEGSLSSSIDWRSERGNRLYGNVFNFLILLIIEEGNSD